MHWIWLVSETLFMSGNPRTVRDLMTTEVITIGMDDTLRKAQQVFNGRRFHHLVVVEGGKPVGVLSDRDLLKQLSPFVGVRLSERAQDLATLAKRIHQFMTRQLISITPDASIAEAARTFMRQRVSCLPVIDSESHLVGIITTRDLVRWAVLQPLCTA
jgi:acetoin utilization protein AcuB